MLLFEIAVAGLLLGGLYALVALGLNLQYGVMKVLNLAHGEFVMLGAFGTYFLYNLHKISPIGGIILLLPLGFVGGLLVYTLIFHPLIRSAPSTSALEARSIMVSFGLSFVLQNAAAVLWGRDGRTYSYLAESVKLLGAGFALNRVLSFFIAGVVSVLLFSFLHRTVMGRGVRAVASSPVAASLVSLNVHRYYAVTFALGAVLAVVAGGLLSMLVATSPTMGVKYTIIGLIVVILGGKGHLLGGLIAGLLLGVAEAVGSFLLHPGLALVINYGILTLVLVLMPRGIMGGLSRA